MPRTLRTIVTIATLSLSTVAALSAATKFTSTFKSMDAGSTSFAGRKVAALVISNDFALRMSAEEALARELNGRGMQAMPSYRIAPKEELVSAETAKPWFEKAGVEGIVVVRPVSAETRNAYTSSIWVSPNYSTLWGYYGYGWGTVYVPGSVRKERILVAETTIYSVTKNQLVWAAVSETSNKSDMKEFFDELAKEMVKTMQKQGLAKGQPR